ncbi:MAG TPA: type II secretion system protein GspG [Gemmatimonadaceae bacterium]|nr:type II secretion system protein GspG [Gemmatimonadaceae bacterium]
MAAEATRKPVIPALCLTLLIVVGACRDDAEPPRALSSDTIAPIGTGTELLLTRERLALIEDWIRAAVARDGRAPASLDAVRPPAAEAARYVPLDRYMRDGWGRAIEYEYTPATGSYELRSPGEDGALGTPDDVVRRQR